MCVLVKETVGANSVKRYIQKPRDSGPLKLSKPFLKEKYYFTAANYIIMNQHIA